MPVHTPEHASGAGVNTVGDSSNHAPRKMPTRNGEPISIYEPMIAVGQEMDESGKMMYGSRPREE